MVIWATGEDYKDSLYLIYPAMAPDSTKQLSKTAIALGVQAGKGWTRSFQVPTVVAEAVNWPRVNTAVATRCLWT